MNDYIKNRIELIELAKQEECEASELDEKYSGALWDWAGEIANMPKDELQDHIYYALQEAFETLYKGA